jgi:alkylhydroperoxidase family enzyme
MSSRATSAGAVTIATCPVFSPTIGQPWLRAQASDLATGDTELMIVLRVRVTCCLRCVSSARRLASIHPDDLADDVGGLARRDEDDRVGDLCRRSAALQGNGRVESRLLLG